MPDLGKAYVQIIPSATGIKGNLTQELSGASAGAGTAAGGVFAGKFKGMAVKTLGALGLATSMGAVLTKGWSRMTAIDTAKAKLTALGNTAGDVTEIANDANASVKGTAFGMDAAMTTAASAVAAGIQPGKELTRYLSLIGDSASVAGISMEEMGSIFNKVAANGKVTTEEMNQLADRGIPIWQLLAKETGMSMTELRKAVTKGEIDINDFQNAIEKGMGGAAKTIGSTTIQGALSNIGASISRMGANLLGSSDDADSFAGKLLPLMNNLMGFMGKIEKGASFLGELIGSILGPVMEGLGQVFDEIGKGTGDLKPLKQLLQVLGKLIGDVIRAILPVLITYIRFIMQRIQGLMQLLRILTPVVKLVAAAFLFVIRVLSAFAKTAIKVVGYAVQFITGKLSFKGLKTKISNTFNGVKTIIKTATRAFMLSVSNAVNSIKTKLGFKGIVSKVSGVFGRVKEAITSPIKTAKDKVKEVIQKIKDAVPFDLGEFCKVKLPKLKISGGKAPWGLAGEGKAPNIDITWHKKGGIVNRAQLIGAGEAGAEAILPLDPFWKKMDDMAMALTSQNGGGGGVLNLVLTIGDEVIGQTAVNYINGQTIQFGASPLNV